MKRETIGIYVDRTDMEAALGRRGMHSVDSVIYAVVVPEILKAYAQRNSGVPHVTIQEKTYPTQERRERRLVVEIEPTNPVPDEVHNDVLNQILAEHCRWEGVGLLKSGGQGQRERTLEYGKNGRIT